MHVRELRLELIGLWAAALLCPALPAGATAGPPGLCAADALFVSDNPEAVGDTRGLFYADTGGAKCVRLLYHHQNANVSSVMAVQVWALDNDDAAARLRVTLGMGGPTPDPMTAGHRAAIRFWQEILSSAGTRVDIPPHRWKPLLETVLRPGDVISGLAQIQIEKGRLTIAVLAYLPGASETDIDPSSFVSRTGTHPFGVFSSPLIERDFKAELDQPRGLVVAGDGYLAGQPEGETLKGNYGVIYHFRVECTNATNRPKLLILEFTPRHGPAAGTMVINGTLIAVPPQRRDAHWEVGRYWIPPGGMPLDIWTFPEGASAYPVRFDFVPVSAAQ